MKIINRGLLDAFCLKHTVASGWIGNWIVEVETATWTRPQDIKNQYRTASFLADNIVIFNVKGNSFRLETKLSYPVQIVFIRWIGTHAEYDKR